MDQPPQYPPPFVTHDLKTWQEYFQPVADGVKPFEIRRNDRNYRVGDKLLLREFIPCAECAGTGRVTAPILGVEGYADCPECDDLHGRYTGRWILRRVAYITDFAQRDGYVVLGIPLVVLEELVSRRPR